jgi:hypothetical protein
VGGPVLGDGMILINAVTSARKLQLSSVAWDANVAWSASYSQSGITAGESFSPASGGSVVIDLAPDGSRPIRRPSSKASTLSLARWCGDGHHP